VFAALAAGWLSATATAAPPTVEQVSQALDVAELAAKNGMVDLSQTAVQRALAFGPPTVSTTVEPAAINVSGSRVDTTVPIPPPLVQIMRERIPQTVWQLSQTWRDHAEASSTYAALKHVVLPPGRPDEIFVYAIVRREDSRQFDRVHSVRSVAQELVYWATVAGTVPDLMTEIQDRQLQNSPEATIVQLLSAAAVGDDELANKYSTRLTKLLRSGANWQVVRLAASVAVDLQRTSDDPRLTSDLLTAAANASAAINAADEAAEVGTVAMFFAAARGQLAAGEGKHAADLLSDCLSYARGLPKSEGLVSNVVERVANDLLRRGMVDAAVEMLGRDVTGRYARRYQGSSLWNADGQAAAVPEVEERSFSGATIRPVDAADSKVAVADQIWICGLDTQMSKSKILFTFPDFQNVSSPVVSPDGLRIAFAATMPGEVVTSGSRIYVATLDGTSIAEVGPGIEPSWSPSGQHLVFSRYSPHRGIWISDSNGHALRLIDDQGWGARWSPDGRRIAYTISNRGLTQFMIADLVEDESAAIASGRRYSTAQSSWNFCWSQDSLRLFVETSASAGGQHRFEFTSLDLHGDRGGELTSRAGYLNTDLLAGPDESTVVFAPRLRKYGAERLHVMNVRSSDAPVYLEGQEADRRNSGMSWMPDHKTLVYLSRKMR